MMRKYNLAKILEPEKENMFKRAYNSIKAAYWGRDDKFNEISKFLKNTLHPFTPQLNLRFDKQEVNIRRTLCYGFDLILTGTVCLTGEPLFLMGLLPSIYFRSWIVEYTNKQIDFWEKYKDNTFTNINRHITNSARGVEKQDQEPELTEKPNCFQQELGLDSIDQFIQSEYGNNSIDKFIKDEYKDDEDSWKKGTEE